MVGENDDDDQEQGKDSDDSDDSGDETESDQDESMGDLNIDEEAFKKQTSGDIAED